MTTQIRIAAVYLCTPVCVRPLMATSHVFDYAASSRAGEDMSIDVALKAVRAQRPGAQPNAGFMRQLANYEASFRPSCPSTAAREEDNIVVEPALLAGSGVGRTCGAGWLTAPAAPSEAASAAADAGRAVPKQSKGGRDCGAPAWALPRDEQASHSPPFRQAGHDNAALGFAADIPSVSCADKGGPDAGAEAFLSCQENQWVTGASVSPAAVCGAAFMAAHCGCDGESDPAPSPQSSAGDCGSSQVTPACRAMVSSGWDIPTFSLVDGFSLPLSSAN